MTACQYIDCGDFRAMGFPYSVSFFVSLCVIFGIKSLKCKFTSGGRCFKFNEMTLMGLRYAWLFLRGDELLSK
eukprot:snap_masked-scaffold_1-processed-gene-32.4-mRNA-1 protein AED:1.00 eAED:1.00 QI:0/0/0/0/1/1/2/0/72